MFWWLCANMKYHDITSASSTLCCSPFLSESIFFPTTPWDLHCSRRCHSSHSNCISQHHPEGVVHTGSSSTLSGLLKGPALGRHCLCAKSLLHLSGTGSWPALPSSSFFQPLCPLGLPQLRESLCFQNTYLGELKNVTTEPMEILCIINSDTNASRITTGR